MRSGGSEAELVVQDLAPHVQDVVAPVAAVDGAVAAAAAEGAVVGVVHGEGQVVDRQHVDVGAARPAPLQQVAHPHVVPAHGDTRGSSEGHCCCPWRAKQCSSQSVHQRCLAWLAAAKATTPCSSVETSQLGPLYFSKGSCNSCRCRFHLARHQACMTFSPLALTRQGHALLCWSSSFPRGGLGHAEMGLSARAEPQTLHTLCPDPWIQTP